MKNLLVIADKSGGSNSGLKRALAIQNNTGATITLVGFCHANLDHLEALSSKKVSRKTLEKKLLNNREAELRTLADKHKNKAGKLSIIAMWGKHIAPAICTYCKEHPVDMVIKSGNHTGSILYTSTDWQLIRECLAPVVITSAKQWKKKPNIIAAVDLSSRSKAKKELNHIVVQQAQKLAGALGENMHIVFALKIPQALADMDLIDANKYAKEKRQQLNPVIKEFCTLYNIDSSHIHIKRGEPAKIIPSIANTLKADIVVTGTVGRKGLSGKLIGNTAESVMGRLRTDVMAVKL
ncbi:MAG: universal stress protein [Oceanicoccus sp.]